MTAREDSSGNSDNDLDVGLTLNLLCLRNPPVENRNTHIRDSLARLSCKAPCIISSRAAYIQSILAQAAHNNAACLSYHESDFRMTGTHTF
jgi:hypothetical protein